jgi:hypothetical protein
MQSPVKRVTRTQAIEYLRRSGAPLPIVRALGDYGDGDPNTHNQDGYNERELFYASNGSAGGVSIVRPEVYQNINSFASYPFVIGASGLSQQIIPMNPRRTLLLVQNLSAAANLYINFSADASASSGILLTFGNGIIFDTVCPNNSISVFYAGGVNEPGIVVEGAPQF